MPLRFSQRPGRHERQLLRRYNNPLFAPNQREVSAGELHQAQKRDHEELVDFIPRFRKLVLRAAALDANENSEVILGIKEELDRCYEELCGLADDQQETRDAIRRLLGVIMNAVRRGAGDDAMALRELEQEELARSAHLALVEYPLVADLLHPNSTILPSELAISLLSTEDLELGATLQIFDPEQLGELIAQGRTLLESLGRDAPDWAIRRLELIESALLQGPAAIS